MSIGEDTKFMEAVTKLCESSDKLVTSGDLEEAVSNGLVVAVNYAELSVLVDEKIKFAEEFAYQRGLANKPLNATDD